MKLRTVDYDLFLPVDFKHLELVLLEFCVSFIFLATNRSEHRGESFRSATAYETET